MYYVYVLISLKDHKLYVGQTADLDRRMKEHANGTTNSTSDRRPLKLIYFGAYLTLKEAKRRELFLKGGQGRSTLKVQLAETLKTYQYQHLSDF